MVGLTSSTQVIWKSPYSYHKFSGMLPPLNPD